MVKEIRTPYRFKKSARATYVRLTVHPGGEVVVTVPMLYPFSSVEDFLQKKAQWIKRAVEKLKGYAKPEPRLGKRAYKKYKEEARVLAHKRLLHFNHVYGFTIGKVSVRNQKTRWGSCSKKGNLNFNYKIALLPARLADYIIVHELCHLKEFNHGEKFWGEVARTVPDHRVRRKELRGNTLL